MWEIDTSFFTCRIVIVYSDVLVWTFCIEWALYDVYLTTFHLYIPLGTRSMYVCKMYTWTVCVAEFVWKPREFIYLRSLWNQMVVHHKIRNIFTHFPLNVIESSYLYISFPHLVIMIISIYVYRLYMCVYGCLFLLTCRIFFIPVYWLVDLCVLFSMCIPVPLSHCIYHPSTSIQT